MKGFVLTPFLFLVFCSLVILQSPVRSYGMPSRGGVSPPSIPGLGTILQEEPLDVSIDSVDATTCLRRGKGMPMVPMQSGWEWLDTDWVPRNPGDRLFSFPHPNHPGFQPIEILASTHGARKGMSEFVRPVLRKSSAVGQSVAKAL